MLVLAFDTATEIATCALVADGTSLGERASTARRVLEDVDALLRETGTTPAELDALVVGTGPGSFTSTRIGLAIARGLALALELPTAGVSTLAALEAGAEGALPLIDARRGELFLAGPTLVRPEDLAVTPDRECVGDGALRHRDVLVARGARVPPPDDPRHRPRAVFHARLATTFGPATAVLPTYVRAPDAVPSA